MKRKVLKCRHLNLGFCEKLRTLSNFSHKMKMSLIVVIEREVNNFYVPRASDVMFHNFSRVFQCWPKAKWNGIRGIKKKKNDCRVRSTLDESAMRERKNLELVLEAKRIPARSNVQSRKNEENHENYQPWELHSERVRELRRIMQFLIIYWH